MNDEKDEKDDFRKEVAERDFIAWWDGVPGSTNETGSVMALAQNAFVEGWRTALCRKKLGEKSGLIQWMKPVVVGVRLEWDVETWSDLRLDRERKQFWEERSRLEWVLQSLNLEALSREVKNTIKAGIKVPDVSIIKRQVKEAVQAEIVMPAVQKLGTEVKDLLVVEMQTRAAKIQEGAENIAGHLVGLLRQELRREIEARSFVRKAVQGKKKKSSPTKKAEALSRKKQVKKKSQKRTKRR